MCSFFSTEAFSCDGLLARYVSNAGTKLSRTCTSSDWILDVAVDSVAGAGGCGFVGNGSAEPMTVMVELGRRAYADTTRREYRLASG